MGRSLTVRGMCGSCNSTKIPSLYQLHCTGTWGAHTICFDNVNVAVSKHVCILLGCYDVSAKTALQGVCDGTNDVQLPIEPLTRVHVYCRRTVWVTNG